MVNLLMVLMLASPPGDVELAQKLYNEAKYQEAQAALGESCDTALQQVRCEEVRASILIAMGNRDLAIVAYARALLLDPKFALPADSSPKLLDLITEASRLTKRVQQIEIEHVRSNDSDTSWVLTVHDLGPVHSGSGLVIEGVTAYFAAPGSQVFSPVLLAPGKAGWRGELEIGADHESGVGRYYYKVTLSAGAQIRVGNEISHRQVRARRSFESDQYGALTKPWPHAGESKDPSMDSAEPTPTWVWVATASGIVAVVVGSVVVGTLILNNRSKTGGSSLHGEPLLRW